MRIENKQGKFGKDDRIILLTSTDKQNNVIKRECISIFKLCVLVNQLAFNELELSGGFKRNLLKRGECFFFEEAIKESIEMAKNNINWAEQHNWDKIKEWATKWNLKQENIENELKRTFQVGLDYFHPSKSFQEIV